jgi:hypothetical protein
MTAKKKFNTTSVVNTSPSAILIKPLPGQEEFATYLRQQACLVVRQILEQVMLAELYSEPPRVKVALIVRAIASVT